MVYVNRKPYCHCDDNDDYDDDDDTTTVFHLIRQYDAYPAYIYLKIEFVDGIYTIVTTMVTASKNRTPCSMFIQYPV